MGITVGVSAAGHIAVASVEGEKIENPIIRFPDEDDDPDVLAKMPPSQIVDSIQQLIKSTSNGRAIDSVGIAFPGIIRNGVVEECPNITQMKGQDLGNALTYLLATAGLAVKVRVLNDADAMAAGI